MKRKVLVQRADKLGDVIFSLPVIENIKKYMPHVTIDFLTSALGSEFLQTHPLINKTLVVKRDNKNQIVGQYRLIRDIKQEKYDVYLSLWNDPSLAKIGKKCGIPIRIGDSSNPTLKRMYNFPVRQEWENYTKHQIDFNLSLLYPFKLPKIHKILRIYTDKKANEKIDLLFNKYLNPEKKKIVIFLGTGGSNHPLADSTIWQFMDIIKANQKFNIILCGQIDNSSTLKEYQDNMILNLTGRTSLMELVSVIKKADYFIGPDTGPTHIASFLGKPLIFYSPIKPNPPSRWGPQSPFFKIIRKEYNCEHLDPSKCTHDGCFYYMDGRYLYNVFCDLLKELAIDNAMDEFHKQRELLINSLRILYVVTSKEEYLLAAKTIKELRKSGLMIFPYFINNTSYIKVLPDITKILIKRNINIIQGNIPKWFVRILQFYLGTLKQYIKPIFTKNTFHKHIKFDEYIEVYKSLFKCRFN
jgi:ADP-heptose:LPS heptosyltransferase